VQLPEDSQLGGVLEQPTQCVHGKDKQLWRERVALAQSSPVPGGWVGHSNAGQGEQEGQPIEEVVSRSILAKHVKRKGHENEWKARDLELEQYSWR
jgi:hypothetical protein